MLNFAKSNIKGISPFWWHVCFLPFQSFSKFYAEFSKIYHQGHLPLSEDMFVFGHSKVSACFMLNFAKSSFKGISKPHLVHLSCSNNIRNSWFLLTESSHSGTGDSRAHTLSVMIRGRRSRLLMTRRMTTGSSLQESCLLTGRDSREVEAWFYLQKSFNTSSFSYSCQSEEIE